MQLGKLGTSFSRGLSQAASHTLHELECQDATNFLFKDRSATVRKGYQVHATLSGAPPIVALEKFYQADGDSYFCAVAAGQLHYSTTSGSFTSISSDVISGEVHHSVFDGAIYFTDYSSPVKYFNGDEVGIAGISSPVFKQQLSDMENAAEWQATNLFGFVQEDTAYLHRDKGDKSITFSASSPSTAGIFSLGGRNNSLYASLYQTVAPTQLLVGTVLRDLSGDVHVVSERRHARLFNNTSTWVVSSPINLSGMENTNPFATNCVDSSNVIHCFYSHEDSTLKYVKYTNSSGWIDNTVSISGKLTNNIVGLSVDGSNNLHIFNNNVTTAGGVKNWLNYLPYYNGSGSFGNVSSVQISGADNVRCVADVSNVVHFVYTCSLQSGLPSAIFYSNSLRGTSGYCITSGDRQSKYNPCIAVDTSMNVHVAWYGLNSGNTSTYQTEYRAFTVATSAWSSIARITNGVYAQDVAPSLSLDSDNRVHLLWGGYSAESPTQRTIRYANNLSGWSSIQNYYQIGNRYLGQVWNVYPRVENSSPVRHNKGYSYVFLGTDNYVKYYRSPESTFDGDPAVPLRFNLNRFATDVSSTGIDLIQLFTVPNRKDWISSLVLRFVDSNTYYASKELCQTSAWVSVSNNEWGMTLTVSKSSFTTTNTAFNWGSCNMEMTLTPVSSSGATYLAKVAVDNIRMLKSPPVIGYSVSTRASSNLLFWGSSSREQKQSLGLPSGFDEGYRESDGATNTDSLTLITMGDKEAEDALQLEGLKQIADPIPSGTWYYKSTFIKESPSGYEMESNPSGQSSGWIVSNDVSSWTYLGLTDIPVAPEGFGVAGRRIYRRKSNESVMRHVYTIHDNATTTFFDTVPNVTLGWVLEEDHNPPPFSKYLKVGSDQRMYYFNISEFGFNYPSRVRISKPYEPYYAPLGLAFDLSPDDGTEGTGMFEYRGIMHFLKERSTWYLRNNPVCANPNIGCVAPRSIAVGRNEVFWLSDQGPIKYNMQFHNISHSVDGRSLYRIQTILDRLPKEYLKNAVGTFFDGYYLLAVTDQGSTVNDLVICYDVDNDVWSTFTNLQVNCWATQNGYKDGYKLFFGNYSGQICEMFNGHYDISTPISWSIRSKEFGIPTPEEFYRKSYIFSENLDGNSKDITVQPYYDFTQNSSLADTQNISGTYNLTKVVFQDNDSASFFSLGISGSGRIKINVAELYAKKENLR